jgi:hypothetical protein
MNISVRNITVLAGAGVLTLGVAAPGFAATTVARASANALTVSIAGNGSGSGTVTATHDGTSEHVQGQSNPPIGVLQGQGLINVGVLAQEATAGVTDGAGHSAACAGVAGEGGSVATIGESSCLVPGQPVGLTFGNLDLSTLVVFDPDSALAPLNQATDPVIQAAIGPITQQISDNVTAQLGEGGLIGSTLGAVEARCVSAASGGASGTANIVDGKVSATFSGQSVDLLDFPVHPAPNTKVVTGLDKVVNLFIEALRTDLNNTLDGQAAPLAAALDPIQDQIVDGVIAQIAPQLKPLEDNVLSATLNEQSRPSAGAIKVTAIDLQVLPAAQQQIGASLVSADIANVTCGPDDRVVAAHETHAPSSPAAVPHVIDSGVDHRPSDSNGFLGALSLLMVTVVGWAGYRGLRRS